MIGSGIVSVNCSRAANEEHIRPKASELGIPGSGILHEAEAESTVRTGTGRATHRASQTQSPQTATSRRVMRHRRTHSPSQDLTYSAGFRAAGEAAPTGSNAKILLMVCVAASLGLVRQYVVPSSFDTPVLMYSIDKTVLPPSLASKVQELPLDDLETEQFLQSAKSNNFRESNLFFEVIASVLHLFYSRTDTNAMLGRGKMFVISSQQARQLLKQRIVGDTLLDVGAGDGSITHQISPLVNGEVVTTEASAGMIKRLQERGFTALHLESLEPAAFARSSENAAYADQAYDLITCFNVLDRADKPLTLLRQIRDLMKPKGKLIVALVLPFRPYVEPDTPFLSLSSSFSTEKQWLPPTEKILEGAESLSFEQSVARFSEEVLGPLGFHIRAISRAPYLNQGGRYVPYYVLDDALFVLSKDP